MFNVLLTLKLKLYIFKLKLFYLYWEWLVQLIFSVVALQSYVVSIKRTNNNNILLFINLINSINKDYIDKKATKKYIFLELV